MQMGLSNTVALQPTFRWTKKSTYPVQDPVNHPYDWTETPTTTIAPADVQVPCAVEYQERSSEGTAAGAFDGTKAIITMLDTDYALIAGSDQVLLGGNVYDIDVVAPPVALFSVDIFTLYCTARDAV
jgi:hypothetical protein